MLINCTPHTIRLLPPSGSELVLPPSGSVVRVATRQTRAGECLGVPILGTEYGELGGFPAEVPDGAILIVSALALAAARASRHELYNSGQMAAPDTGPSAERDTEGRVLGVYALLR